MRGSRRVFRTRGISRSWCRGRGRGSGPLAGGGCHRESQAAEQEELTPLTSGKTILSFVHPAQNADLLESARVRKVNLIAMDMVPRISRAQKMDALSSTANIAGYRAVIEAGNSFGRFFTGQVTAAGKVAPAKVLVIGAGVAGLAAIGTSTALGAITYAFDVRPEVAEQIESMGAEFVFLDFADQQQDGAASGGYATPSSPEFRNAQLSKFRELAPQIDIVISTALIPGRDAPRLWLADMVEAMKPGSVIVDLAAERGGNCELTIANQKVVTPNGVTIIGYTDFPSRMAEQASTLYSNNIRHLIADLTPSKDGCLAHDMEDDVIRGTTVTHEGMITYPPPRPRVQAIAAQKLREKAREPSPKEKRSTIAAMNEADRAQPSGFAAVLAGKTPLEMAMMKVEVFLGVFIGAITFTGSAIAFGKLAGKLDGKAQKLPGRHALNAAAAVLSFILLLLYTQVLISGYWP